MGLACLDLLLQISEITTEVMAHILQSLPNVLDTASARGYAGSARFRLLRLL